MVAPASAASIGHALEVRPGRILGRTALEEVIPRPQRVGARGLGGLGSAPHVVVGRAIGRNRGADAQGVRHGLDRSPDRPGPPTDRPRARAGAARSRRRSARGSRAGRPQGCGTRGGGSPSSRYGLMRSTASSGSPVQMKREAACSSSSSSARRASSRGSSTPCLVSAGSASGAQKRQSEDRGRAVGGVRELDLDHALDAVGVGAGLRRAGGGVRQQPLGVQLARLARRRDQSRPRRRRSARPSDRRRRSRSGSAAPAGRRSRRRRSCTTGPRSAPARPSTAGG